MMSDDVSREQPTLAERAELGEFWRALRETTPRPTRRDLLRWTALAAGALATARVGLKETAAAPDTTGRGDSATFQATEIETNVKIAVPFDSYGQAVTLDPHLSIPLGGFWVLFPNVWGGLVRYNEIGKVELDLAESFTKSDDGLTYTFKIRPDAKYANGKQVVADHFIQSWHRALNPAMPSPMAQFMSPLKGFASYIVGKSDQLGIKAVDNATVQITLDKPYSYFLSYLAAFVWDVVDPAVITQYGDAQFPLHDGGTGPWRFTSFQPNAQLVMQPNTHFYGGVSPSIAEISWALMTGPAAAGAALDMYKQDKVVSADVPISLLGTVQKDATLSKELVKIAPSGFTRMVEMDFKQPPFDDVRVRRAFAMAVDRNKWSNDTFQGTYTPTAVFTPPVVTTLSGYKPPAGLDYNPDQAKKLLAEVYKDPKSVPGIVFYLSSDTPSDEVARWQAFVNQIQSVLGVAIKLDATKTSDQIEGLRTDNGGVQFGIVEWQTITETPHLLSDVFRSDSQYMKGYINWGAGLTPKGGFDPSVDSKTFDGLMTQADTEPDQTKRNALYKQGEELVLNNAVGIPLGNWVQMYVQKPWLQGTKQGTWTGRLPVWFDKNVVVVKH